MIFQLSTVLYVLLYMMIPLYNTSNKVPYTLCMCKIVLTICLKKDNFPFQYLTINFDVTFTTSSQDITVSKYLQIKFIIIVPLVRNVNLKNCHIYCIAACEFTTMNDLCFRFLHPRLPDDTTRLEFSVKTYSDAFIVLSSENRI